MLMPLLITTIALPAAAAAIRHYGASARGEYATAYAPAPSRRRRQRGHECAGRRLMLLLCHAARARHIYHDIYRGAEAQR